MIKIKKNNKFFSIILILILLLTTMPSISTENIFAQNFNNCSVSELNDYSFIPQNKLKANDKSTKGIVVDSSSQWYERINGESMMNFPNVPYYSIGIGHDEGTPSLLPETAFLKVRYDIIGTYNNKNVGAFLTIKNPVNMTKLALYSDFWYGCYLIEKENMYGSADLEMNFFYSEDPDTIIKLGKDAFLTAASIASFSPDGVTMSYEGINFDNAKRTNVWIKKEGLIVQENFYNKDLFYCKENIESPDIKGKKYVDKKGHPTFMNCGVMFQQDDYTWKCTPVVIRETSSYGASWTYFVAEQLNFHTPDIPKKEIISNKNNYHVGDPITYKISQKINTIGVDGYGKYNKLEFIDELPQEVDFISATLSCDTGEPINSDTGILNYDADKHTVKYTFSNNYLNNLQYKGQTFSLTINCKINKKAEQVQSFSNKSITLINNEKIVSETVPVAPKYKITTEVINGTISPNIEGINKGENRTVNYSPSPGYMLKEIVVDGEHQDINTFKDNYLFPNIITNHHIKVVYEPIPEKDITITKIWRDLNNKYQTRPDSLKIDILGNGNIFKTKELSEKDSTNNKNIWSQTLKVPLYDKYGNPIEYSIREQITPYLSLNYIEPVYNQKTLTVTNEAFFAPMDAYPGYQITIRKDIINSKNQIANKEDFDKIKLDINGTYKFPIVLKAYETILYKDENGKLCETYGDITDISYRGIVTNKGDLTFTNIPAGKYEIMEEYSQYFDFVNFEKLGSYSNTILTKENGKYFITLPGLTAQDEEITIKVINKIYPVRPYDSNNIKNNLFKK